MRLIHITVQRDYEVGSMPPDGYLEWQEWAETQHKAGLRQKCCMSCGKWQYPQEIGNADYSYTAKNSRGEDVKISGVLCVKCTNKEVQNEH